MADEAKIVISGDVTALKESLAEAQMALNKLAREAEAVKLAEARKEFDAFRLAGKESVTTVADSLKDFVESGLSKFAAAAAAAFAVDRIKAWAKEAVAAFAEAELTAVKLEHALKNVGETSGEQLAKFNSQQASLMSKTIFGDEAIADAQRATLKFKTITGDMRTAIVGLSADIASMEGGSIEGVAQQLSRALDSPQQGFRLLRQYGIQFTESQKDVIKYLEETGRHAEAQAIIFDELSSKYKGAGEVVGDTLTGEWAKLENAMGEVAEKVGGLMLPLVQKLNEILAENIKALDDAAIGWTRLGQAIGVVAEEGKKYPDEVPAEKFTEKLKPGETADPFAVTASDTPLIAATKKRAKEKKEAEEKALAEGREHDKKIAEEDRLTLIKRAEMNEKFAQDMDKLNRPAEAKDAREQAAGLRHQAATSYAEDHQFKELTAEQAKKAKMDALDEERKGAEMQKEFEKQEAKDKEERKKKEAKDAAEYKKKLQDEETARAKIAADFAENEIKEQDKRIEAKQKKLEKAADAEKKALDKALKEKAKDDGFTAQFVGLEEMNRKITAAAASTTTPEAELKKAIEEGHKKIDAQLGLEVQMLKAQQNAEKILGDIKVVAGGGMV